MKPFEVTWSRDAITALRDKIGRYRFPAAPADAGWRYGCDPDFSGNCAYSGSTTSTSREPPRGSTASHSGWCRSMGSIFTHCMSWARLGTPTAATDPWLARIGL